MAEETRDAQAGEWSTSANDAIKISLCSATKDGPKRYNESFNPTFTYAIFDDEQIFGYKGLKINLRYRCHDMRPHLSVSHIQKFQPIGGTEAADVKEILKAHLPPVAFTSNADFVAATKQVSENWTPPGELHKTIQDATGTYEIWKGSLADPAVKQLVNRVQIFVPMLIEAGTYIGHPEDSTERSDDDRWTVFFLYKKDTDTSSLSPYVFIGYSTIYRYYFYNRQQPTPPSSPKELELSTDEFDLDQLPCRSRISQFVILSPFQAKGNGQRLYSTIFEYYNQLPQTKELTVEDPNEAFDVLRDLCDLAYVNKVPEFKNLHINTSFQIPKTGPVPKGIVDQDTLDMLRKKAKIAPRQFSRIVEMYLMSKLPASVIPRMPTDDMSRPKARPEDIHRLKLWELFVKMRLYKHNRDMLGLLEKNERIEKIQETLGSVEFEYAGLLDRFNSRQRASAETTNGKRKADGEVEDHASKKPKVSEA